MHTGSINGGETLVQIEGDVAPYRTAASLKAALQDARDEIAFMHSAFRELYLASIPLTGDGMRTQQEWGRWFHAMHDAHGWTMEDDDPLWPEWAGPEPK